MILAARNGVYGLAMSRLIGGSLARRLVAAHLVIDESTAMATAQRTEHEQRVAFWITGRDDLRLLERGDAARRARRRGDRPRRRGASTRRSRPGSWPWSRHTCATASACSPALLGAAICLVLIPFTPVGVPILCSSAAILIGIPARDADTMRLPGTAGVP